MLAAPHNEGRANAEIQQELDSIVAGLPTTINNGPASISQHPSTCRIHCSNPDDISRVQSFEHFQDMVIGATKDGLYFVADKLERMFPENAMRTKVLLGSLSVIQLLKDNGGRIVVDASKGTLFKFPVESMTGGFQDPFFTCDPPSPMPPLPSSPLQHFYSTAFKNPAPSFASPPSAFGMQKTSGLLIGANVKVDGIWKTLMQGKLSVWQTLASVGVKSFCNGLIIGFVDEIIGSLVPARYRSQLLYIKNLLKGAAAVIGTCVVILMLVNKPMTLTSAITSVLISYAGNLLGGAVGLALGRLLHYVKRNYFTKEKENESDNLAPLVDLVVNQHHQPPVETFHCCGLDNNGFMHIGLCINCNVQPAVFGFVHRNDNTAHSAFCLTCASKYTRSTCICCAEVSSTYYFAPDTPMCQTHTCILVGKCVTCDENDVESPNTASVWRLRKSEETQVTNRTVTLDVRYCLDHRPLCSQRDLFRYGKLYATGYM